MEKFQRVFSGRIMRFGAVGGVVTVVFMALNALFGRVFGLSPQLSFFIAYPPALALHFLLNKLWTFGDRTATTHHQLGEYLFSVVVTFLIQWPSFLLLQHVVGLPGWVAAGGANVLQMSASYALLRWKVFHASGEAKRASSSNPWHRLALLFTVIGGCALIYWTAMGGWVPLHFAGGEQDYYNQLVSGFRKGSLALDVPVPDALKHAENPWDPAKRPPGVTLHDASYNNGHFYLYFGVVPAVLLFWPFRAVFGTDLPYIAATLFYITGAFLISSWLWLKVLRERFPKASLLTKIAGPLVLGLCGGQLCLARRVSIWEMPIAAGHFYLVCLVVSSYWALQSRRYRLALAAAGLSLGLAIGCRPTLAAAGAGLALLVVIVGWTRTARNDSRGRASGLFLALLSASIPFAAVVSGLMAYNWCRFGSVLEFGLNYQLTSVYEAKAHHFLLRFLPFNLHAYFLRPPQWGRYFPFLHPLSWIKPPADYYGMEFVYGALVVCPVLWWALPAFRFLRTVGVLVESSLAAVLLMVAAGTTFALACFNTAASRYVPDFLPWWLWLALLGWARLETGLLGRFTRRYPLNLVRLAFGLSAAVSIALAFLQSAALHGILARRNHAAYVALSRVLDWPAAAWERMHHELPGAATMDVTVLGDRPHVLEPLLITGVEYESDYFFIYYKSKDVVRLGYESAGDAPVFSPDIPMAAGRSYHLRFAGGSLFPPDGHPAYSGWTDHQVHAARSALRIEVDGRIVVNQQREFHDGAPEFLQVGSDVRSGAFGRRFSGTISNLRREPLVKPEEVPRIPGDVVLNVTLPEAVVPGSQPLLVAGDTGSAELVGLRMTDDAHFVLAYEKWGAGVWESDPIPIPQSREASFRIRLGSILPPHSSDSDLLIVWMNGLPVWWRNVLGGVGPDPAVEVLINSIGSSTMRSSYQGNLLSWRREPLPLWKKGAFNALELDLAGSGAGIEPIVVTGVAGRADLMAIEWLPGHRARLLLDHWSHPGFASRDFEWTPERMHHLKLSLPSFGALDNSHIDTGTGLLRAEVDGVPVWEEEVPFYGADSSSVVIGKNPVGSSMAGPALGCRVGDLRQDFLKP